MFGYFSSRRNAYVARVKTEKLLTITGDILFTARPDVSLIFITNESKLMCGLSGLIFKNYYSVTRVNNVMNNNYNIISTTDFVFNIRV